MTVSSAQVGERFDNAWIAASEVVVLARPEVNRAAGLEGYGTIAVEFDLINPARIVGHVSVRNNNIGSMNLARAGTMPDYRGRQRSGQPSTRRSQGDGITLKTGPALLFLSMGAKIAA
jgi:hypothetical protein